ncbi:hypothetical protein F5Y19DRAFT_424360 [Xylariaceae sp. FL1651]|nr:hypothetical protein F5Y19DRAFT_424360 [Xylariaceae sp. FL1651]
MPTRIAQRTNFERDERLVVIFFTPELTPIAPISPISPSLSIAASSLFLSDALISSLISATELLLAGCEASSFAIAMVASLRSPRRLAVASFVVTCLFLLLALRHRDYLVGQPANVLPDRLHAGDEGSHKHELQLELVVASTKKEDTSWLHTYLPDWHKSIYVTDDARAPLTVPKNKGREAMVYLTYIIDNYEDLPRNILFLHASRFAWHNDDPDYDALPTLQNFRLPYLQQSGYVNLRCVWVIGCPAEIRPAHDEANRNEDELKAKHVYKKAFEELLPEVPVPDVVAVSCCSQFGATRETIRSRPKADYIRYRDWLLATPLDDALNGRVFEFAWHSQ